MSEIRKYLLYTKVVVVTLFCVSCSISSGKKGYKKTPVDEFVTKYINEPNYSVILADMDYKEDTKSYYHKYKIVIAKARIKVDSITLNNPTIKAADVVIEDTDWKKISDVFFDENIDNLGMTILSKKDGVLDKKVAPAGFDNYVGNERYGRWENNSSGGGSFWAFYGQYHFMSSLFYGASHMFYRNDYNDYNRNYRGSRGYYGSGSNRYGTSSSTTRTASTWNSKPSTFKNKVRSSVKQSATTSRSRSYRSNSSYSKTKRNSSRYSNSSSSRSRSGGFGK